MFYTSALIFALIGVILAICAYLDTSPHSEEQILTSMATSLEEKRADFAKKNLSAFVVGYSGEVGREVAKQLANSNLFKRVVLIGRRKIDYKDRALENLEQTQVDFDNLDQHKEVFKDLDVGFCCLGTTRKKSGADGFYRVDHDYVMNSAKLAKEGGCKHFQLVSSVGANKDSWFLYPRTKGEVEAELTALQFEKLSIFRPALLMCDREEGRSGEAVLQFVMKPMAAAFPTVMTVPTETVAKAMVNTAVSPASEPVAIFDNKAIHKLAKGESEKHK